MPMLGIGLGLAPADEELVRRLHDLSQSLFDFGFEPDVIGPDWNGGPNWVRVTLDGGCGYQLMLEARKRKTCAEVGFTLIEQDKGFHTPVLRFYRRLNRSCWTGLRLNMDYDSYGLRILSRKLRFTQSSERVDFSDRSANAAFGGACSLLLSGTP